MSIYGSITVECDSPDCHAERDFDRTNLMSDSIETCLLDDDWEERDGGWICPQCCEEQNPREKGDDDGREYGHPGDALADRE